MSKKKTKAKQQGATQKQNSNDTILQITAEELQNIIANALLQAEEKRKQIEKDKQEQERQKWREEIGYKDYSKSKSKFAGFLGALNEIKCGIKLLFIPSKKIKDYKTISASLNLGLSEHYELAMILSFLSAIGIVVAGGISLILYPLPWYFYFLLLALSLCFVYLGLKNRIAYHEVTYIKDDNLILNILASHNSKISMMISVISIVIAIIAILK